LNEGANPTHTSFPTTYVGGTISNLRLLPHGPPFFIGCIENLLINGQWVRKQNNILNKNIKSRIPMTKYFFRFYQMIK